MWQHVVETMLGSKAQLDSQLQRVPVHSDRECMVSGKLAPRIYMMADCIGGEGSRESPVQVISPFVDWMTWVFWCLFFCSSVSTFDIEFQVWSVVSEDVFPQPAGCFSHWLIISCAMPKHWISGDPICQFLVLFSVLLESCSKTSCLWFSFEALYLCFASDWVKVSGLTLQSVIQVELDFVQGKEDLLSLSM